MSIDVGKVNTIPFEAGPGHIGPPSVSCEVIAEARPNTRHASPPPPGTRCDEVSRHFSCRIEEMSSDIFERFYLFPQKGIMRNVGRKMVSPCCKCLLFPEPGRTAPLAFVGPMTWQLVQEIVTIIVLGNQLINKDHNARSLA